MKHPILPQTASTGYFINISINFNHFHVLKKLCRTFPIKFTILLLLIKKSRKQFYGLNVKKQGFITSNTEVSENLWCILQFHQNVSSNALVVSPEHTMKFRYNTTGTENSDMYWSQQSDDKYRYSVKLTCCYLPLDVLIKIYVNECN